MTDDDGPQRLQKVLAHAGLGSRRAVEELIAAGRVAVNGKRAILGARVDPTKDKVEVDGSMVPLRTDTVHYLFNKPRGVITSAADPQGRDTVLDLIDVPARVWPVGRLDLDSEGALIVTNDGELTHRLTHPSYEIPKTYWAKVSGAVGPKLLRELIRGVPLDDGPARASAAEALERAGGSTLVEITVTEGRNRMVRRMFEALDHPVTALVRVAIGPLRLGRLKPGTLRRLTIDEVRELYRACDL